MSILGMNIKKIEFEKTASGAVGGKIEVNLSPKIKEMRLGELKTPTGKINGIEILFEYNIRYNPEIARAVITGEVFYVPPQRDKIDALLDVWEKEKKMDPLMFAEVVNSITHEITPLMMAIAKEMRLPYHVPLPRVQVTPGSP